MANKKKVKPTSPGYDPQYKALRETAKGLQKVLGKNHTVSIYFDYPKKVHNQLKVIYWDSKPPKSFFTRFNPRIQSGMDGTVAYLININ